MTMGGTELQGLPQLPYSHEVAGLTPLPVEQGLPSRGSLASSNETSNGGIWAGGGVFVAMLSFFKCFYRLSSTTSQKDQREQTYIRSV